MYANSLVGSVKPSSLARCLGRGFFVAYRRSYPPVTSVPPGRVGRKLLGFRPSTKNRVAPTGVRFNGAQPKSNFS
jgi:hypothetical protein